MAVAILFSPAAVELVALVLVAPSFAAVLASAKVSVVQRIALQLASLVLVASQDKALSQPTEKLTH